MHGIMNLKKLKSNLWMEHRRAQFRLAIQVVWFKRIYLPNFSIILFTSVSLR